MVSFGLASLSLKSFAKKMLFLTMLDRIVLFTSPSVLLGCRLCPGSGVPPFAAAVSQKLRTLPALSLLTIPGCGLVGGDLLAAVCSAATFSLIWNVEGEFRRLEPGEISRSVVSSAILASVLLRLVLFDILSGETFCGFDPSYAEGGLLFVDDEVVPERSRVLRLGGRFSVSVMVQCRLARDKVETKLTRSLRQCVVVNGW